MRIILLMMILLHTAFCFAEHQVDLLHAFQDAAENDPLYQQQVAIFNAAKQEIPESFSALLPTIDLTSAIAQEFQSREQVQNNEFFSTHSFMLLGEQTVFNYSQFNQLDRSRFNVRAAYATLTAQQQDLMARTAKAYLDVLRTREIRDFIEEQQGYMKAQLEATQGLFEMREATITDLEQAKGTAYLIDASYYDAKIDFYNAIQVLSEITSFQYKNFPYLDAHFPLHSPNPQNVEDWTTAANKTNWLLRAARISITANRKAIQVVRGDYLPNVKAVFEVEQGDVPSQLLTFTTENQDFSYGLNAAWNIFKGGLTIAQEKEAKARLKQSEAFMRQQYLQTMSNTRQAFNTVLVGVPRIKSIRDSVVANTNALLYAQEAYRAGESTLTEILQIQSRLYTAQIDYADFTYEYLYNIILLKQAEGTLSIKDLALINSYLKNHRTIESVRMGVV